jgi:hypothetical protein
VSEHRIKAQEQLRDVWSPGAAATVHALFALGDAVRALACAVLASDDSQHERVREQLRRKTLEEIYTDG